MKFYVILAAGVLFFAVFGIRALAQPSPESMKGFWVGNLPGTGEVGIAFFVAKSVYPTRPDSRKGELLWGFISVPITWAIEGDGIAIYKEQTFFPATPELDFKLKLLPSGNLDFSAGGLVTKERLELFNSIVLVKTDDEYPYSHRASKALDNVITNNQVFLRSVRVSIADLAVLLAADDDFYLRYLLQHPGLSAQVLDEIGDRVLNARRGSRLDLAKIYLLRTLAANPGSSVNLLRKLLAVDDPKTWLAVKDNPKSTSEEKVLIQKRFDDWEKSHPQME